MKFQLVIQFPLVDASAEDFERLIMIETELGVVLRDKHHVHGHYIGADEINIFIHTNDPSAAFEHAKQVLSEKDLATILVAFKEIEGSQYSLIWPTDFEGEFKISEA